MKILFDLGASTGSAIPELVEQFGPFDRIVAVEANPTLIEQLRARNIPNLEIINAAVAQTAGRMNLYLGNHYTESSTLLNKRTGDLTTDRSVEVEAVTLPDLVQRWSAENDRITCKMDIEGAEFDVLEGALRNNNIKRIDTFLIEWHVSRFPNKWTLRLRRMLIKVRLAMLKITVHKWR